jgi:UDP-N-acetylmuramoyl-tripeptide--D-alanyl-D-alanine ligase
MIALSVAEIAEIMEGTAHLVDVSVIVNDLVTDSRQAVAGAMFVAIRGENVDGHDFAASAIDNGASVVLAGRELDVPCIVVSDPVLALAALARWVRENKLSAKVIAITGSSGKTSTKDLLAQVLSTVGKTVAAVGSFNTEVGVPLTILRADEETQFLVLEMGMRGAGHLTYLTEISAWLELRRWWHGLRARLSPPYRAMGSRF